MDQEWTPVLAMAPPDLLLPIIGQTSAADTKRSSEEANAGSTVEGGRSEEGHTGDAIHPTAPKLSLALKWLVLMNPPVHYNTTMYNHYSAQAGQIPEEPQEGP